MDAVFLIFDVLSTVAFRLDITSGILGELNAKGLAIASVAYGLSFIANAWSTFLVMCRAWCVSNYLALFSRLMF